MKIIKLILVLFGAALFACPAIAKTIKIESENFVLVGDVREKDAKKLVTELETYRSAILQLLGATPQPEAIRVRIYMARGPAALKKLTGRTRIGGIYTTTLDGPVFFLNSQGGFGRGKEARHIALHEYTHHLLAAYTKDVYPRWYNEGLANYLSTFEMNKKGQLVIGRPYQPYGYALSQSKWMPTNMVVSAIRKYPFKANAGRKGKISAGNFFYAQSWLAVHYIQSTIGETQKLAKYIRALNSSRDNSGAFAQAFGRSPEQFHAQLRKYYRANNFAVHSITSDYDVNIKPLKSTILDKPMAQFHKAEAMRFFSGSNVKTAMIEVEYDKAVKAFGLGARKRVEILAARADLASWENDFTKANAYIEQALKLTPNSAIANRTAGMMYIYKNEADGAVPNSADMKLARKYLKKALLVNGNDIAAHYQYAKTYSLLREVPSGQALASAQTALDYYRSINFVETNLMLASILMRGGKHQSAQGAINKAIIWSHSLSARRSARSMRKHLDNKTMR